MRFRLSILILLIALLTSCARTPGGAVSPSASQPNPYRPIPYVKLKHPEWSNKGWADSQRD